MLKKQISRLINRYGLWRSTHIAIIAAIVILACVFVLEVAIPVRSGPDTVEVSSYTKTFSTNHLSEILKPESTNRAELTNVVRRGLFKPATPLRDKPMADKTIERIRSQVKLQCIMEINGEPIAYVNIKGAGLKKCKVGDSVKDLFTVVNIREKSIEISIVGHKEVLNL